MTGTRTKPWPPVNMLPNIKTCENGWSNFSENLIIVAIKLLELLNSYHQIYPFTLSLCGVGVRCDGDIFIPTARLQSICGEIYDCFYCCYYYYPYYWCWWWRWWCCMILPWFLRPLFYYVQKSSQYGRLIHKLRHKLRVLALQRDQVEAKLAAQKVS